MTECPKCKGYGIVGSAVPDILRGRGAIFSSNECDMCHGSGEVQMTNEEWLRSCTTEQLAEWLAHHSRFVYECGEKKITPKTMYEEDWEWWLKQPHKDGES